MKKTLLSQAVEVIMARIMYTAVKAKENLNNIKKPKTITKEIKKE